MRSGEDVIVVDPGAEPDRLASLLDAWGGNLHAVVLTHAHVDHVGGVAGLVNRFGCPVYLHADDLPLYERAKEHGAMFGAAIEAPPPPDHWLEHGQSLAFGNIALDVRHAPGHSPGGVVLVAEGEAFVGDCVFSGSIGRTDLPGGDTGTLLRSIREQILTLPPATLLYSGHGPVTTVEAEAESNPFVGRNAAMGW